MYLANFNRPYLLWAPAILLIGLGLMVLLLRGRPQWVQRGTTRQAGWLARTVQSPPAVVAFMLVSGLLQAVYWIRQGGDFMHGRVLLTPMFCLLAPVAVIPLLLPDRTGWPAAPGTSTPGHGGAVAGGGGMGAVGGQFPGPGADATRVTYSGIVDERRFYSQATGTPTRSQRPTIWTTRGCGPC